MSKKSKVKFLTSYSKKSSTIFGKPIYIINTWFIINKFIDFFRNDDAKILCNALSISLIIEMIIKITNTALRI